MIDRKMKNFNIVKLLGKGIWSDRNKSQLAIQVITKKLIK